MQADTQKVFHLCIVKTATLLGLALTKQDGTLSLLGFESKGEGLSYFERAYMANHGRGYEGSMSACLNSIEFQPSILPLHVDEVRKLALDMRAVRVRSVSGSMTLLPLIPEQAEPLWQAGAKPRLI